MRGETDSLYPYSLRRRAALSRRSICEGYFYCRRVAKSRTLLHGSAAILFGVPVKVRELIKELEAAGWVHVRTKGDHRVFRHTGGRITVVSGKLGDDVRPGTYKAILKQIRIKEEQE
jgi:predicted RNA binding protein YcfA (HicA-like mRNA interferase family)